MVPGGGAARGEAAGVRIHLLDVVRNPDKVVRYALGCTASRALALGRRGKAALYPCVIACLVDDLPTDGLGLAGDPGQRLVDLGKLGFQLVR